LDEKFEIGGHTLNHPNLDIVDVEYASREILDSKNYLENITGRKVSMFCYPSGRYNDNIKCIVKNSGFIGARTCGFNNFNGTKDKYEFHPTLYLSNASPMSTFKMYAHNVISISSLMDWETRAIELFDKFLEHGGIFHIWGHSWEFERKNEWDRLERTFKYISNRKNIKYLSNGEVIKYLSNGEVIKT
jgi:peptidoglycan/xylan/chitin deacetylase (PgdA/CDA1 family)